MVGALEADGAGDDAPLFLAGATIGDAAGPIPGSTAAAAMAAVCIPGDETGSGIGCVVGGLGAVAIASAVVVDADGGIDTFGTFGIVAVGTRIGGAAAAPSFRGGELSPGPDGGGVGPAEGGRFDAMEWSLADNFWRDGVVRREMSVERKIIIGFHC